MEEGLNRTTKNATEENANIYNEFEQQMQQNGQVQAQQPITVAQPAPQVQSPFPPPVDAAGNPIGEKNDDLPF